MRYIPSSTSEVKICLHETFNGQLKAAVVAPLGCSVFQQMGGLKKKYPKASVDEIANLIVLDARALDQQRCPRIERLVLRLKKLRIPVVVGDVLWVDTPLYEFWSTGAFSNQLHLVRIGPDAEGSTHPLWEWAEQARSILMDECAIQEKREVKAGKPARE